MAIARSAPGVLLVLLDRGATSTKTLVFGELSGRTPLACASSREDMTQWELAESLAEEVWANEITRLYASSLLFDFDAEWFGVFVGFLDGDATDAPLPVGAEWIDLRESMEVLPDGWGSILADVRADFIGRSPDEAMRVR